MANVIINDTNLFAIADAIRGKNGESTKYKPNEMAAAITAIETGGGEGGYYVPDEVFTLSGDVSYWFAASRKNDWLIEYHLGKLSTQDITSASYMFSNYANQELDEIPFDFNFKEGTSCNVSNMFASCKHIKKIGKFINLTTNTLYQCFNNCYLLRELPEMVNVDISALNTNTNSAGAIFQNCYSLRSIPESLLKQIYNNTNTSFYSHLVSLFASCYALNEIKGINLADKIFTSNMLANTFGSLMRVKEIQFALNDDGTPLVRKMKSQTINLADNSSGYAGSTSYILNYNSGITEETRITDAATYELYKNHPDSWTTDIAYSRYNHDSALNTIKSLPDTSAYLATDGGTNTIKFKGSSGSATDGGAINTLTEEEIAIATAKGWTVSFS